MNPCRVMQVRMLEVEGQELVTTPGCCLRRTTEAISQLDSTNPHHISEGGHHYYVVDCTSCYGEVQALVCGKMRLFSSFTNAISVPCPNLTGRVSRTLATLAVGGEGKFSVSMLRNERLDNGWLMDRSVVSRDGQIKACCKVGG